MPLNTTTNTVKWENIKQENLRISKEEIKLSLFAIDMIVHIENPRNSTGKLSEWMKSLKSLLDTWSIHTNNFFPIYQQ